MFAERVGSTSQSSYSAVMRNYNACVIVVIRNRFGININAINAKACRCVLTCASPCECCETAQQAAGPESRAGSVPYEPCDLEPVTNLCGCPHFQGEDSNVSPTSSETLYVKNLLKTVAR